MPAPETIQSYLEQLGAPDVEARNRAVQALVEIGESAVVPLIQLIINPCPGDHFSRDNVPLVRNNAMEALRQIGKPAMGALRDAVSGNNSAIQELLLPLIIELGNYDAKATVHKLLQEELAEVHRERKSQWWLCLIGLICMALLEVYAANIPLAPFVVMVPMIMLVVAMSNLSRGIRKTSLAAFSKAERPEWAGLCALCLTVADAEIRKMAEGVLIRMLPHLKENDKTQFGPLEMETLIKSLSRKKPELTRSILKALEQIGDERALPHVEALAAELAFRKDNKSQELYEAAEACLPFLRQRAEQSRQANTLLRASLPSAAGEEVLLRPVQNTEMTPPEEMLRPVR
jgi:HEAT repeat protein